MRKEEVGILTSQELERLEKVIGEIELKTSAEVRLMIVKKSAAIGHVFPLLWAQLTALLAVGLWLARSHFEFHAEWILSAAVLVIGYSLAWILARVPFFQRWMTPEADRDAQVWARAEVEFHREGLTQTVGKTGVLLFISLMEREAVVLGDRAIAAKLPTTTWNEVIAHVMKGAKSGEWANHLEEALRLCGARLADSFPIQSDDRNELVNAVILKD